MTPPPLWLQNAAALSLQIAFVTAGSAVLALGFRLRPPAARLAYWQLILLICIGLPAVQPWKRPDPRPLSWRAAEQRESPAPQVRQAGTQQAPTFPLGSMVFFLLVGGTAVRFIWILLGFYSLRRFRRTSRPLDPLPLPIEAARERLGVRADFFVSDRILGPITFGIRRPLILLPVRVFEMPPSAQEAIACHELIHVRRRDWVWTALEEIILGAFWFHPAVWWVVGQVRLAREQVVDLEAVDLTQSRTRYVEALLAVAGFDHETFLTPAALFLERRHLAKRVTAVLKESNTSTKEFHMSKKRLMSSLAAGLCAAILVAGLAVVLFPLHARIREQAAEPVREGPVQVESGGEYLLHGGRVPYPESAIRQRVEGAVVVEVNIDERGLVSDARVLSGPEQLRRAALSSVLQWHYDPARRAPGRAQVTIRFHPPQEGNVPFEARLHEPAPMGEPALRERLVQAQEELERARRNGSNSVAPEQEARLKRRIEELERAVAERSESGTIGVIRTDGLSKAGSAELLSRLPVRVGDSINADTVRRIQEALRNTDEHLCLSVERDKSGSGNIALIIAVARE